MLKRMEGLAGLLSGTGGRAAGLAAVLAGALALAGQAAWAEDAGRRAVSTRGDASVTVSGSTTRSNSSGTATRSRSATVGRPAPSPSSASRGTAAHSGNNAGRRAVPRSPSDGVRRRVGDGSHHGGGRGGGTVVIGHGWWYDPWYYGPSYGWGYGWGWASPWYWGPAAVRYDGPYRSGGGSIAGALDLDLWPDDVEVYVDGEYVGEVDQFDGFPTFLWLPRGTYDVVFYRDGFQTLARQYSIYSGQVVDVNDRLERGESIRPEDLPSTSSTNRDARVERNRQRREAARRYEQWRERARYGDDEADEIDEDELEDLEEELEADGDRAQGGSMARLRLSITPEDASIYLDGNFLGTAREVAQLSAGLVVPPGSHRLEVVRPGYEPEEVRFDGEAGEELSLQVDLERE
jgi:hypothetical protein